MVQETFRHSHIPKVKEWKKAANRPVLVMFFVVFEYNLERFLMIWLITVKEKLL